MEMEKESLLVTMCLDAACMSKESIEKWRRQRRTLEHLPSHLARSLLQRLIRRRLLFPSLLEVFKYSVEDIDFSGDNTIDAEWTAYIGAFRYLRSLHMADCHRITNSSLWSIAGMACLKELNLSRCLKVTDVGVRHLLSISTLEKLWLSETGLTADGVSLLSSLKKLSLLDVGGLPVTDSALNSLQELKKLQHLDLWGSKISNQGAAALQSFPLLTFLNLAWTNVTKLPNQPSLQYLNMSNCTVDSILEGNGVKARLSRLILSGAAFINDTEAFPYIETSDLSFLDVSKTSLHRFCFLSRMVKLEHLDLSSTNAGDDSAEDVACIGATLRSLDLSSTKFSSTGIEILAGHLPNLESLSLSSTFIDDVALPYISMMPSLKVINLSDTNVKGFIYQDKDRKQAANSLAALQSLGCLERLNLEQTLVRDEYLDALAGCKKMKYLTLKCAFLTDVTLQHLSSLLKLTELSVYEAVVTNSGLEKFTPPSTLRILDLRGCWLLTEDGISVFMRRHPHIEVRHELAPPASQSELSSSNHFTLLQPSRRRKDKMQGKVSMPRSFIDQRLKYSREELLGLQYSSLAITFEPTEHEDVASSRIQ